MQVSRSSSLLSLPFALLTPISRVGFPSPKVTPKRTNQSSSKVTHLVTHDARLLVARSINNKMADRAYKRLEQISEHLNSAKLHSNTPQVSGTAALELDTDSLVLPNDLLTQEQVDFYNKNGYLVVRNLVPQDLLSKYLKRFHQICDGEIRVPGITVMKDVVHAKSKSPSGERTVNKLQNFEQDEVLFSYCELPQILKYVACFTGPDVKSVHTMLINKPPDPGTMTSRHPLHQDLHYFPFRPANRMVCSWTAMEKVDRKNGCLVVIPGTHYSPLLQHYYPEWEVRETQGAVTIL